MNTKLTKRQEAQLEASKKSSIISWKGSTVPIIDGPFYSWCRRTRRPYVQIQRRRAYADVFWDLPNASGRLDQEGYRELLALLPAHPDGSQKPGNTIAEVPLGEVDGFAAKLVEICLRFCQRHQAQEALR